MSICLHPLNAHICCLAVIVACLLDGVWGVQIPPWQGTRVPLVIVKVFASGTTAGSDPFYVQIAAPVATSAEGSTGTAVTTGTPVCFICGAMLVPTFVRASHSCQV